MENEKNIYDTNILRIFIVTIYYTLILFFRT